MGFAQIAATKYDVVIGGMVGPLVCVVFEKVGWASAIQILKRSRNCPTATILPVLAVLIVVGAESLRFCALLAVISQRSMGSAVQQLVISVATGVVSDVFKRTHLSQAI